MAVTTGKNPKAAKRGTYTLHPPSNAEPKDANGDELQYVKQDFPRMVYGKLLPPGAINARGNPMEHGGYDHTVVANEFEFQKALDEGWTRLPGEGPFNGKAIDFEESVPAEEPPAEPKRKKPGPKPKLPPAA